jgi:hypothetical protein
MKLPVDIQEIFFETLNGDKSISEFEEWLYNDKSLETIINSDDYLDLISYNYKTDTSKKWLYTLFEKYIDKGEFEKRKIRNILAKGLIRNKEQSRIIIEFYDLYCKGYIFLDKLGLGYGLAAKIPFSQADSWDELTSTQQNDLLNSFYPGIEIEILRVISWIDSGEIVLTGIQNELGHNEYIDNRSEVEKAKSL